MSMITKELPSLVSMKSSIPIVTDDEQGVCIAIDKTCTGVICIKCWNHIINSVELWLRRHGAKSTEFLSMCQIYESYFISKHTKII